MRTLDGAGGARAIDSSIEMFVEEAAAGDLDRAALWASLAIALQRLMPEAADAETRTDS
jgi:hypothetical protein